MTWRRVSAVTIGGGIVLIALAASLATAYASMYLVGDLEPYDSTCIGGHTAWAVLLMAPVLGAVVAGGAAIRAGFGAGSILVRAIVALCLMGVWALLVGVTPSVTTDDEPQCHGGIRPLVAPAV